MSQPSPDQQPGRPEGDSDFVHYRRASPQPRDNRTFQRDELPTDLAKPTVETDELAAAAKMRHWANQLEKDPGHKRHISFVTQRIELPRAAPPDEFTPRSMVHQVILTVVED
jgi:hypothetical protein